MNIAGIYKLGHKTDDNLDFDVKMNQTEAIIFEPFIKDLVSNIKGTISTNLKMTGPPSKPQLNGNIILSNTGVTVNYLKTALNCQRYPYRCKQRDQFKPHAA